MSFVEFHDVKKIYHMGEVEIPALQGVNFEIEKGEFCVIVGASGAGKTTILNILGGMDTLTEGKVLLDGKEISSYGKKQLTDYRRYDIGFVFQFYNLVGNLTALENVELASQICSDPLDAGQVLADVGLADRASNFPAQLSGGEQQRVILARALTQQTECLVLDEPTNHLDIKYQLEIMDIVKSLDVTVIAAVHDLNIAAMYCDRLIAISGGKVAGIGTPRELLTAEFIKELYGVDSRVDIEEATGRMNIVYLPRHWKKEKETL